VNVGRTDISKQQYTEHLKIPTPLLIKLNFAEHLFNTNDTYTNLKTNFEILHTLPTSPKLNTTKQ
jgi:hypothetical protein